MCEWKRQSTSSGCSDDEVVHILGCTAGQFLSQFQGRLLIPMDKRPVTQHLLGRQTYFYEVTKRSTMAHLYVSSWDSVCNPLCAPLASGLGQTPTILEGFAYVSEATNTWEVFLSAIRCTSFFRTAPPCLSAVLNCTVPLVCAASCFPFQPQSTAGLICRLSRSISAI